MVEDRLTYERISSQTQERFAGLCFTRIRGRLLDAGREYSGLGGIDEKSDGCLHSRIRRFFVDEG